MLCEREGVMHKCHAFMRGNHACFVRGSESCICLAFLRGRGSYMLCEKEGVMDMSCIYEREGVRHALLEGESHGYVLRL